MWTLLFTSTARCFTISPPSNAVEGEKTTLTYTTALTDPDAFTIKIVDAAGLVESSFPAPPSGGLVHVTLTIGTTFPPGTGYTFQFFALNSEDRLATSQSFTVTAATKTTASSSSLSSTTTKSTTSKSTTTAVATSTTSAIIMSISMTTYPPSSATSTSTSTSTGTSSNDTGALATGPANGGIIAGAVIAALVVIALVVALRIYLGRRKKSATDGSRWSDNPGWWPRSAGKKSMFLARPWTPPLPPMDEEKGGVRISYAGGRPASMAPSDAYYVGGAAGEGITRLNSAIGNTVVSSAGGADADDETDVMPGARASSSVMVGIRASSAVLGGGNRASSAVLGGNMDFPALPSPVWVPPPSRQMREKNERSRNLTVATGAPDHHVSLPVTARTPGSFSLASPVPPLPQPGMRPSWAAQGAGARASTQRPSRVIWTLSVAGLTPTIEGEARDSTAPSYLGVQMRDDQSELDSALREYDVASVHNSLEGRSQDEMDVRRLSSGSFSDEEEEYAGRTTDDDESDTGSLARLTPQPSPRASLKTPAPPTTARQPAYRFSTASNSLPFTPSPPTTGRPPSTMYKNVPEPPRSPVPDSATFAPFAPLAPPPPRRDTYRFPPVASPSTPATSRTYIRPLPSLPGLPTITSPTTPPATQYGPPTPTPSSSSTRPLPQHGMTPTTPSARPPLPPIPFPLTARPNSELLTPVAPTPAGRSTRTSAMSINSPMSTNSITDIRGAEVLLAHWQTMNRTEGRLTMVNQSGEHAPTADLPVADERW